VPPAERRPRRVRKAAIHNPTGTPLSTGVRVTRSGD
jgi:hypothetical protein